MYLKVVVFSFGEQATGPPLWCLHPRSLTSQRPPLFLDLPELFWVAWCVIGLKLVLLWDLRLLSLMLGADLPHKATLWLPGTGQSKCTHLKRVRVGHLSAVWSLIKHNVHSPKLWTLSFLFSGESYSGHLAQKCCLLHNLQILVLVFELGLELDCLEVDWTPNEAMLERGCFLRGA